MGHPAQGNRESPRLYNESRYLAAPPPSIGGSEGDQRIVGGTVAEEGEFPWAVALSLGKLLNTALVRKKMPVLPLYGLMGTICSHVNCF